MSKFVIAGITQIETIVNVDSVPIEYAPLTFRPNSIFTAVGGDAYNESLALIALGNQVKFLSEVGRSQDLSIFNPKDTEIMLPLKYMMQNLEHTPTAVILCDNRRNQQIFEDIKDLRDSTYDMKPVPDLIENADMVILSNANFCRPIAQEAVRQNKKIAVNIRSYNREKEKYNEDFLSAADLLYVSDDNIDEDPYDFVRRMAETYDIEIVILGQGKDGCILFDKSRDINLHYNAVKTANVVNTAGAGNALFSCFIHFYQETNDSTLAIKNALLFASYKIGFVGTSMGLMTIDQLEHWRSTVWGEKNPFASLLDSSEQE